MSSSTKGMRRWVAALILVAVGAAAVGAWFWRSSQNQSAPTEANPLSVEALRAEVPGYFNVDLSRLREPPGAVSTAFGAQVSRWTTDASLERSVATLDALVVSYLKDHTVSRTEKIAALLALARSATAPESRRYLIDCVAAMQPLEFAGQLVDDYRKAGSTEEQVALLRAIASAFVFAASGNLPPELLANVELIQSFFRKEFTDNTNPAIFSELLRMAHSILPAAEASTILRNSNGLVNAKDSEIGDFYIDALVADKAQQQHLIAQIVELYQSGKLTGATEFVNRLLGLIEADRERNIFDAGLLQKMLPLLKSTEPSLKDEVGFDDVLAYAKWVRAVIAANNPQVSPGQSNSTAALLEIATTVEPVKAAALIAVIPLGDLEHSLARNALYTRLDSALSTRELSRSQRRLIEDAMARLRRR